MANSSSPTAHFSISSYAKAATIGALTALLAVLPVSIVKTIMLFASLCIPLTANLFRAIITPTTCGLFLDSWDTTPTISSLYISLSVLGGALAAIVAVHLSPTNLLGEPPPNSRSWKPSLFWRAFVGGLLFDVLFVFLFMYPGQ